MSPLAWLAIPAVALVLATLWVGWRSRPRPRADTHETVEAHQRFVAAFESRRAQQPRSEPGRPPQPAASEPSAPHRKSA